MSDLTAVQKVRLIARTLSKSMGELAEATGQTRQNLSNKMSRGNLSEKDILGLAEAMGCSVEIIFTMPDGTKV